MEFCGSPGFSTSLLEPGAVTNRAEHVIRAFNNYLTYMIEQLRKVRLVLLLLTLSVTAFAQDVVVNGRVTSELDGTPLPGVSVLEKGTSNGTSTDSDGNYTLRTHANSTLVFSFIGFGTQEIEVGTRTTVNAALAEDITQLGEVVVTALGIKKEQKALGYSVSTVNADQLTQAGTTNFATALYGKAAGLKITTAPGGSGSAVNVQIRGINSLNYNQQPLYIVDGIVIRNDGQYGADGANNNNYDKDQRIRGNGILDINPTDIESVSILKGASASALYGSDASSGVIVITTKKGVKRDGLGIDLNYTGTVEEAAFLPEFQNVYGPGYTRAINVQNGANANGWITDANSPTGFRPYFRAYAQFGPKMEGQEVLWWDGSIRSFEAREDNYKDVFDKGYSSNLNIALSNQTDKVNYRLSASHLDYKGTNPGSKQQKNTFSLNSTVKLHEKVSADVVVSYINTKTHNRAYQLGKVLGDFGGFFSRAEDMDLMREKFRTSEGYKFALFNTNRPERFLHNIRASNLLDFFWNQLQNDYDETENRLMSSATLTWDVTDHLKFRGRVGNDFTALGIEDKRYTEQQSVYNSTNSTGAYSVSKGNYAVLYGDVLATYSNKLNENFDYSVSAGFQSRREDYKDQTSTTKDGLVAENWFAISNSYGIASGTSKRSELLKYAYLGMVNLSYKNIIFLEGTARQEYVSSLPPSNNSYFYPSVNGSFVFSDAFELPQILSYGKLRASYGMVANAPPAYESNVSYVQTTLQSSIGPVASLRSTGTYGNEGLEPEKKYETEIGLETRLMDNRFGVDISVYTNTIKDQILGLSTAPSVGATSQIINVGEIGSKGLEIALNATPVDGPVRWDARFNVAFNRSEVKSLAEGVSRIVFYDAEQSGLQVAATPGDQLGNIYVYPRATDGNGNYIIDNNGLYVIDKTRYVKAGNIMPKAVGGFSNTVSYKNFALDFTMDYRIGGQMVSAPLKYGISAGLYENTLKYRDAEHGGMSYTVDGVTYNDGVLLEGVNANTGEPNTRVLSASEYYFNTFAWGNNAVNEEAVFDNSYIKMREMSLTYRIPAEVTSKLHLRNVRFSLIGRNLFYIWRTLENLDPEAPLGNKWWSQGVDVGSSAATRSYGFSLSASF
jgi:iron complex outermembrane receptor protein